MNFNSLVVMLFFIVLCACKKSEDRTCLKFRGDIITDTIELDPFNRIEIGKRLQVELVQDSVYRIELIGGKNLLNHITYSVENESLILVNRNKCNFLRKDKSVPKVIVHTKFVSNILFMGSEDLMCRNQLKTNYFTLTIKDGSGCAHLNLEAEHIFADASHGWGDYIIEGDAKSAIIGVRSNSFCTTRNLKLTDSIYVMNESQGDITINADNIKVSGYIKGDGNVYYHGNPTSIEVIQTSKGTVKKLN